MRMRGTDVISQESPASTGAFSLRCEQEQKEEEEADAAREMDWRRPQAERHATGDGPTGSKAAPGASSQPFTHLDGERAVWRHEHL